MRLALTAAMLAALAAACGEKPATTDGAAPAAPSAAPTPAPSAAPAAAPAMEGPAAGKWSVTMSTMGRTLPPTEVCYEKQMTLAEAQQMQQQAGVACSEQSFKREGDAWLGHSVCGMEAGGTKMTTTVDTRVTGDFSSRYTMEMTSKISPPPAPGLEEQKTTVIAERIGDC